jgi:small subunit ribosomal protein S16
MVRIRLRRVGLKKQPSYRIVIADQRQSRNGGYIENVGFYNPRTRPTTEVVDEARILHWLSVGAQPTEAVNVILKHTGTLDRFARLRNGEAVETLVAEAEAQKSVAAPISPKTRYASPASGAGTMKPKGE